MLSKFNMDRFNADYAIGRVAEDAFLESLDSWNMKLTYSAPTDTAFYPYDFRTQNNEPVPDGFIPFDKWEIKCDMGKTPNIPVQFWSSSKKESDLFLEGMNISCNSGIYKTECDLYCVFNPHDSMFYVADRVWLRVYLELNPQVRKVIANKGKSEQTGIALIPKREWLKEFDCIPYQNPQYKEVK